VKKYFFGKDIIILTFILKFGEFPRKKIRGDKDSILPTFYTSFFVRKCESALRSFSLVTNCNERKAARSTFVQKKFVRKMLMKLATGADFINIFAQLFL